MCSVWMTDTSSMIFDDKVRKQKLINMNYSTPLKMTPKIFDFSYIDYSYETSLLCAEVHSSLFRIRLENSYSIGFPRNDTIIKSNKADRVRSWLMDKTGIDYKYLLVYAPTYRDYTGAFDSSFLGFEIDDDNMRDFLEKNNIVMVTKYHPLQLNNRFFNSKRVVSYENGYSFSLYDLLAESDALITDYSSVMHDYILSDKPVILNCFDEEMYDATRGFAFEPLKEILPGIQVRNEREFTSAVTTYVINRDEQYNYQTVKSLFHKFTDDKSSKRAAEHIMSIIKEEKSEISPLIPER